MIKCCYYLFKDIFDFIMFDIMLLYILIRSLCYKFLFKCDWGKVFIEDDKGVVYDIIWIREFRNEYYVYIYLVNILNEDYKRFWENL